MASRSKLLLGAFLGLLDLLDEFLGILVEILLAILATQFDFTVLLGENVGIAHTAQFLVRNRTDFEGVGFGFLRFLRVFAFGRQRGEWRGQICGDENSSGQRF